MKAPKRGFAIKAAVCAAALTLWQAAGAASVTWYDWSFDYEVSGEHDGLSLKNLSFKGRTLIFKISLPVMRVFYQDNVCGPFADRLGGTLSPIPWANNATLAMREFTLDGKQWYEIGIRDEIGNYDLYQVYYLSADGILDAHLYGKGLQCVADHVHYPSWRIDFDVDGAANNQIERSTGAGHLASPTEFDLGATAAVNHGWRVRNTVSNLHVDLLPGFGGFSIPGVGTTIPVTDYLRNTVFGRVYKAAEDSGWTYGPNTQVPHNEGEALAGADIVAWYEAYMPHAAVDGSGLWHSTGIRLVSSLTDTMAPSAPANLLASAVGPNQVNLLWSGSLDNVGVGGYAVERCQGAGCSDFTAAASVNGTTFIDTGVAAGTSYRYRVRALDAAGNTSAFSNPATAVTPPPTPLCTVAKSFRSISDDKIVHALSNTGSTAVTLDALSLVFPAAYVSIKEVKLGGSSIFKSGASQPGVASGVTLQSWTQNDPQKRSIRAGDKENLEIVFTKKSPKSGCAAGSCMVGNAAFLPGCQVDLGP